jgi:competence ComEA-like helix-hairpin-helix protein
VRRRDPAGPPTGNPARAAAILLLGLLLFGGSLWGGLGRGSLGFPAVPVPATAVPAPSAALAASPATAALEDAQLDLNTAGLEALQGLPGIGAVLAQRILDWREAQGPFRGVEDLARVPGIGAKRFERLRPLVRVGA